MQEVHCFVVNCMGDVHKGYYGERKYLIRAIKPEEADWTYSNLIDKEQWNIRLAKFKAPFTTACQINTFVTEIVETKEIIAVVRVIVMAASMFQFQLVLSNLVVRKDHRRLGHGTALVKRMFELYNGISFTLTAVPGTQAFYSRLGFREIDPPLHIYYLQVDREKVDTVCECLQLADDLKIKSYKDTMWTSLTHYDHQARGHLGTPYLLAMIHSCTVFLVASSQVSGQILGYASVVYHSKILWIEAMYADSDDIAIHIFRKILEIFPCKDQLRIQTIKPREFLIGFGDIQERSRINTRMSTGIVTLVSTSKMYAVTDYD